MLWVDLKRRIQMFLRGYKTVELLLYALCFLFDYSQWIKIEAIEGNKLNGAVNDTLLYNKRSGKI